MTDDLKHVRAFVAASDDCEVTVRHYADGAVMVKQGDDMVYVPAELVAFVAHSLMLAQKGARRETH